MTRFVRISFASMSILFGFAIAACGGGDDGVTIVDAAADAAIDAPIDAPPLVCNAPTMNCGGQCVNTTNSEMACGNCTTMCTGGRTCNASACACPNVTIATTYSGSDTVGGEIMGILLGTSSFSGDALLIVGDPANTVIDMDYTMSEANLGTLPTAGFAINLNIVDQTADASFAATEGTLRITKICPGGLLSGMGGLMGTLTNVKFSAVDGLFDGNPVITPGGCTLPPTGTIASVSFSLGNVSCSNTAQ